MRDEILVPIYAEDTRSQPRKVARLIADPATQIDDAGLRKITQIGIDLRPAPPAILSRVVFN
ncbi:hypothetical protein JY97_17520 [Alkalispirochaeta odontotermitis]|nr:hypothetical protein JY97_17520 [Alkalispirochaeta odontotermitis]